MCPDDESDTIALAVADAADTHGTESSNDDHVRYPLCAFSTLALLAGHARNTDARCHTSAHTTRVDA